MVSTFTSSKHLEEPANGDYVDTWDVPVNANSTAIDTAFGGSKLLNATGLSGDQTLALADYRPLSLLVSGLPTAATTYVVPSGVGGQWVFQNGTTGGFNVGLKSAAGGSTVVVAAGATALISCDGSATGMRLSVTTATSAGGSNTQVQYNSAGSLAGSANFTFNGVTALVTGLNVGGNAILGSGAGSTLAINGTAVTIPNNLNIGANALFINTTGKQIGVGTTTVGSNTITAAGVIQSTAGGFKFPDNSIQTSAAGAGGAAGSNTWVQYNSGGAFGATANFNFVSGTGTLSVPVLTLTGTPLAVTSGGTGVTTSTGSGDNVLSTSPIIGTPTITMPAIIQGTITSSTLLGAVNAPTQAPGNNTTLVATTAFVTAATSGLAPFLHKQVYTTGSNTFTPTVTGIYKVIVTGGGGTGGVNGGAGDAGGGGGGAGGTSIHWLTLTASTGYPAIVGGAGTASSFNTTVIGGGGGNGATGGGGAGGSSSGGTINISGGSGTGGSILSTAGVADASGPGTGGASIWGGGAYSGAGLVYGSGGGGGSSAGAGGIILIEWVSA
jgi:hypothetical protein